MVFAGEMPEGSIVQFMKANFERLIDASSMAAAPKVAPRRKHDPSDLELFRLLDSEKPA